MWNLKKPEGIGDGGGGGGGGGVGVGAVADLVERLTVTPLTQVRFPGAARDFFSQGQLSVRTLLRCPYNPPVQSHALTSVRTLKIL